MTFLTFPFLCKARKFLLEDPDLQITFERKGRFSRAAHKMETKGRWKGGMEEKRKDSRDKEEWKRNTMIKGNDKRKEISKGIRRNGRERK